jgi:ABC-type phosphonate transport system ATPase subunit
MTPVGDDVGKNRAQSTVGAPLLDISGIFKELASAQALDEVALTHNARERLAVLGENGAGKIGGWLASAVRSPCSPIRPLMSTLERGRKSIDCSGSLFRLERRS